MRQQAGSLFLQCSTVLRIGARVIQCRQGDVLLGHVLGTFARTCRDILRMSRHVPPPLLMLPSCMMVRKSLVPRPVRAIRVSRGGFRGDDVATKIAEDDWGWGWLRNTKMLSLIRPYWSVHQIRSVQTSGSPKVDKNQEICRVDCH